MRSIIAIALIGAVSLAVSGCGDTTIDDVKTEETLKASLERSLHEKIKAVDCPSGVKVETGHTFTCAVDLSTGEEAIATMKIRNQDADLDTVGLKPSKQREAE